MKREINGHTLYFVKIAVLMQDQGDGSAIARYFQTLEEAEAEYENQDTPFAEGPETNTLVFEFIDGDLKFIGKPIIKYNDSLKKVQWNLKGIGVFDNDIV